MNQDELAALRLGIAAAASGIVVLAAIGSLAGWWVIGVIFVAVAADQAWCARQLGWRLW